MKVHGKTFFVLVLLWLLSPSTLLAAVCDADDDGDIDRNDINLIVAARNMPASDPDDPMDADGDGVITILDARTCTRQCTLSRCTVIDPPLEIPSIAVSPRPLAFGNVFVGSSASLNLTVANIGSDRLEVTAVNGPGDPFSIFPPTVFGIDTGAGPRTVAVGFAPTVAGEFNGSITINSNAANEEPVTVAVTGTGLEPAANQFPDITSPVTVEFGAVDEGVTVSQSITVLNRGDAPLNVSDALTATPFTVAPPPGDVLPVVLDPGTTQNFDLTFTPAAGTGGTPIVGSLDILSDDPDEPVRTVSLAGSSVTPLSEPLRDNPIIGAAVDGIINGANCVNVSGSVQFAAGATSADLFQVVLTDQGQGSPGGGGIASSIQLFASDGAGSVAFNGIDACALLDGVLTVEVVLGTFPPFLGDPAVKNTTPLPAPVLDPLDPVTSVAEIEVCGTSRESTTVRVAGGANVVATSLDASTTDFCVTVPLRRNTQNTLVATAIDNLATAPRPVASAEPVVVVNIDPSTIVIATVESRPLDEQEIADLVQQGIIDLNDAQNFNVSIFTVVFTIGAFPVAISQPVVMVPGEPVAIASTGGGWSPGTPVSFTGGNCAAASCTTLVVVTPPVVDPVTEQPVVIPGVLILEGRIKTLKEFFQITLALLNTSTLFDLVDLSASIDLPSGLTLFASGPGTDVAAVNAEGAVETIAIDPIGPGETSTGQFVARGDTIGPKTVAVNFDGLIVGGGVLAETPPFDPIQFFSGQASTQLQVFGPPELGVVLAHPQQAGSFDVSLGEIFDLIVEITNLSSRPALYSSLDLFVGGQMELVDENNVAIPEGSATRTFGTIPPGQTASTTFRIRSLLQGDIIACQGIASENITLSVDAGSLGQPCEIANTVPANFQPLPADRPPTLVGIQPLNGASQVLVTSSVFSVFTPETACIVEDTFDNVVTEPIDPSNPSLGDQVVSADLLTQGTFYLEELDAFGDPVRHVPVDLTVENPPAGGTTIAVLRLGLETPLTQFFLSPNTTYRATLVGADVGGLSPGAAVCNTGNGTPMENTFRWTFKTEQDCALTTPPTVQLIEPPDGSIDNPVNQRTVLAFTNQMDPSTFRFVPGDLGASTFGVYENATVTAGEISDEGTVVPGSGAFADLNTQLRYAPQFNLSTDSTITVRITDGIRDVCGNPLLTPPIGRWLFSFETAALDTIPPVPPIVNPVPVLTSLPAVQVTGSAEPDSTVTVIGPTATGTGAASNAGAFNVTVGLDPNSFNPLQVTATDPSGNVSDPTVDDSSGNPLVIESDATRPAVAGIEPPTGSSEVERNTIVTLILSEAVKAETVNGLNFSLADGGAVAGTLNILAPDSFTFTPTAPLDFNTTYTINLRGGGLEDLAGNTIDEFNSTFTTVSFPTPSLTNLNPDSGIQGEVLTVTFTGANLAAVDTVISDNAGVTGIIQTTSDTLVTAEITITPTAAPGATTLGLANMGGSASLLFTVIDVPDTITLTPSPANMLARDTLTFTASLDAPALSGGLVVDLSADNAIVTLPAQVTIAQGTLSTTFDVQSDVATGAVNITASSAGLTADTAQLTVNARDYVLFTPFVGLDRTVTAGITLTQPAPAGGATLALSVDDPTLITVAPTTIVFAAGESSATFNLTGGNTIGSTLLTVDGTATGYELQTRILTITDLLLDLPAPQEIGLGATVDLQILVSPSPAPAGGLVVDVVSSDPTIVDVLTPTVTIPEGQFSALATVQASSAATGTAIITASNPSFAPDTTAITVSSQLDILETVVELEEAIPGTLTVQLSSGGVPFPAPAGGVTVDLASSDTDCAVVPAQITVPEGSPFATADVGYGGVAATPCTATISVSAALFGTDTVEATVDTVADIGTIAFADVSGFSGRVGAGLQQGFYRITLSTGTHGGVTVKVQSSQPSVALLSASALTPGSPVVEVPFAPGVTTADIFVQGVATGSSTLTATEIQFTGVTTVTNVELPVLRIIGLTPTTTTLSPNDGFQVQVGLRNPPATGNGFLGQAVSAGAGPLTATLTSDDTAVAALVTNAAPGGAAAVTVDIPVGGVTSPFGIAAGGVELDPAGAGTVNIAAEAPGVDPVPFTPSSGSTTVTAPVLTLTDVSGFNGRVGAGLQQGFYRVTLGAAQHGGVVVDVTIDNPGVATLSDGVVSGVDTLTLSIPNGSTIRDFVVQGVAPGAATVTATQALFGSNTQGVTVELPVLRVIGLIANTTTLSPNDGFQVQVGLRNPPATGNGFLGQVVSESAPGPLTVTLTSDDVGVAELVTSAVPGGAATVTVDIPVGGVTSPFAITAGGVELDPTGAGTVNIAATAPGIDPVPFTPSTASSNVTAPVLTLADVSGFNGRVGAGLQQSFYRVTLGATQHGGVDVTVTTSDIGVASLATTDGSISGVDTLTLSIPNGASIADFVVQGAAPGAATITASQALFSTDGVSNTQAVAVELPVLRVIGLIANTTTLSPNDGFQVQVGLRNPPATGNGFLGQVVSQQAAGPLTVTLTSDDAGIAELVTSAVPGGAATVTVDIPIGGVTSPFGIAAGGVELDPIGAGTVNIAATAPGIDPVPFTPSSGSTTVTAPVLTLADVSGFNGRVGAGLQQGFYRVTLGATQHGGVDVTVTTSDIGVASLATTDGSISGVDTLTLSIPNGASIADFVVQGAAPGAATITASQALFDSDTQAVAVELPVLRIIGLITNTTTLSPNDEFQVQVGLRNPPATGNGFLGQVVSQQAAGPLTVTLASDDAGIAELVTSAVPGGAATVTVDIPIGAVTSPFGIAAGGVELDPTGAGTVNVAATAPGIDPVPFTPSTASTNVTQSLIVISDVSGANGRLGAGLQSEYRVTLQAAAPAGGVTIRVTSSAPGAARVAPDATTIGTAFVDLFVADGGTTVDFVTQGVTGAAGMATLTGSDASGQFASGTFGVQVVQPVLDINGLTTTTSAGAADDEFQVFTATPSGSGSGISAFHTVSAAAGTLSVAINSSNGSAGELFTTADGQAATVSVQIPVAANGSPVNVGGGGSAFRALAAGATTVSADAAGFDAAFATASELVTVNP